ncbi:MAG: hypothetical protein GX801_09675 [Fibrobacter sp.]|nr:hypothetical protein [Fibrobacter sp.]
MKKLLLTMLLLLLFSCGEKVNEPVVISCTPENGRDIEFMSPKRGDVFAPGETVVLKWRAKVDDFTGFLPMISLNNSENFDPITDESIFAEGNPAEGDYCVEFSYTIPADMGYNDEVWFRVKDYSDPSSVYRDQVGPLTVKPAE